MIRKFLFAIACFTISAAPVSAQELNVWLNGGWQGLSYKIPNGKSSLSGGGDLGLGYTFPVSRHWNVIAGLTGGTYGTSARLNDGTYTYNAVDKPGSAFQYDIKTTGYKETQRFFSFGVPVMLQYHTTGSRTQWYLNGGAKLLLPFDASVKSSAQQLILSGYYPDLNVEISNLPEYGFGTISNWQGSTTSKLKTGAALDAETGFSFVLSRGIRLYTGLYLEYGLTDMKDHPGTAPFVPYDPNGLTNVPAGSVLNMSTTGSAKLFAFGVTVKLGFGHIAAKPKTQPKPQQAPPQPQPAAVPDTAQSKPAEQPKPAPEPAKPVQQEKPAEPEPTVTAPAKPAAEEVQEVQRPVVFAVLNKTSVPEGLKPHLDSVADILKKYPAMRIAIIGHTCSIGTEQENIKVGEARARSVAQYLQNKGIDAARMDIASEGEANPAFPNNTAGSRSKNRRVTIDYLPGN